jgi:hypothetical protein
MTNYSIEIVTIGTDLFFVRLTRMANVWAQRDFCKGVTFSFCTFFTNFSLIGFELLSFHSIIAYITINQIRTALSAIIYYTSILKPASPGICKTV